jgi:serine carboxypeptidase-like clade 2
LFLESPAGVGYSTNKEASYQHNDMNTANDNFAALLNFFQNYPEYAKNPFWIAGESYAGKYIPDLAVRIDAHNRKEGVTKINLLGVMIGNGVISFENGQLDKSGIEFMIDHDFIDPELVSYYNRACLTDPKSAGCQYFNARYADNV